jgi:hypothetical protein
MVQFQETQQPSLFSNSTNSTNTIGKMPIVTPNEFLTKSWNVTCATNVSCTLTYDFVRSFNSSQVPIVSGEVNNFHILGFYDDETNKGETLTANPIIVALKALNSLAVVSVATAAAMIALAF